jgi:hypothetical protein
LLDSLSPEQKKALRENMRAKYDSLIACTKRKDQRTGKKQVRQLTSQRKKTIAPGIIA